jgi:uncharacterized membrane protein
MAYLASYVATLVVVVACDFVWLATVGASVYRPRLGDLLLARPVLWAAALFYLVYAAGIVIFAVAPALRAEAWGKALWLGALFGFFAYATYDLSNLATVRGWSGMVAALDMGRSACLTALGATVGYLVAQRLSLS